MDLKKLRPDVLPLNGDYYIRGPAPFIEKHYRKLLALGISKTTLHYEEFGLQVLVTDRVCKASCLIIPCRLLPHSVYPGVGRNRQGF